MNSFNFIDVPTHWKKDKIKYCFTLDVGLSITKDILCASGIKCINYGYIHKKGSFDLDLQKDILPFAPTEYLQKGVKSLVKTGDFVFCDTSEDIEGSGNFVCILNDCDGELFAGSHTIACKKLGVFNSKFLAYFCATDLWKSQIQSKVSGTKVYSITQKILKEALVFFPPLDVQQRIADFIDAKCAHIDDTIAKEKELIEKLKEYRQSVITEAVTKGLNPSAPMKDSGIDWIGEIPDHWNFVSFRYKANTMRGKFTHRPRNDPSFYDGEYPFIQTGDITSTGKYVTTYTQTLNEKGISVSKEFPKGTLVMSIAANIGDIAILDFSAYFPDSIVGIIPKKHMVTDFIYFYILAIQKHMSQYCTFNTQANINTEQIGAIKITVPPLHEQQEIAAYLDKKTSLIDHAINQKEQLITRLNQYKKSLIYEVVTGKMEIKL